MEIINGNDKNNEFVMNSMDQKINFLHNHVKTKKRKRWYKYWCRTILEKHVGGNDGINQIR